MSRRAALAELPPDAQVPARWVEELLEEEDRQRIERAAVIADTFELFRYLATRNYSGEPSSIPSSE